ncbi:MULTISPECIES: S-methyl-5-thioribose-1-phosphate isomerase [Methylosinus]|uniref:Methylthioribose-1-phosphate isomerase n=1 Tax=Methylosinus trichosporium (strain ATCC 35070 / NCIMB 11131 / UNIQEM 75 / OB3b) TaxID=595536 RepID=A0A2D2D5C2_METT3|nr:MULTISPECIES: S-methyl-5-thioribose-1-phosphate isomerase [Methylosinus]ATQ70241.1 S-methyl-5-thioribose-1-phosphate isomerase [Methylosinus trichosporium OB3b]OBS51647.1 S-methyl-5-thioribose-1-phosphate isomerase [Methylosinus sp. 3S-1]
MRIQSRHYRTIWPHADGTVEAIDQTLLPHRFETRRLAALDDAVAAIATMVVRGAPLIGVTGAYGLALAAAADPADSAIEEAHARLAAARPTAVNLRWALDRLRALLLAAPPLERRALAFGEAAAIADEDALACEAIGDQGAALICAAAAEHPGRPVNILTHCNAGWLCAVDWGTALAPIYKAARDGVPLHVWVDETRPRNQGASLTAFELGGEGVPHTVIADNAGGHLMQHGLVDLVIVGSDRTTRRGDVCNKIGTYLKALAAHDNGVPFYVALPSSTIDWTMRDGVAEIPIEERDPSEVTHISGRAADGATTRVQLTPDGSPARNWGFDVTPARLVGALITERGVCAASEAGLRQLFPDLA